MDKFHEQVLILNLAFTLIAEIYYQFPSQQVSISAVTAGFICLSVITDGKRIDFEEFSNEMDMLSSGLAISDISVRASTLNTVYERVIQNAKFNMEKIRMAIQMKVKRSFVSANLTGKK